MLILKPVPVPRTLASALIVVVLSLSISVATPVLADSHPEYRQDVLPETGSTRDEFGTSVAAGGGLVVVGSDRSDGVGTNAGAAVVFHPQGDGGYATSRLTAADPAQSDFFGYGVDTDGDTIVVGAWGKDTLGVDAGAAYVFSDPDGDGDYSQIRVMPDGIGAGDRFGFSVAVDQGLIVIGAYFDDEKAPNAGAAYVFADPDGDGAWDQVKLTASDGQANDYFGYAVDVSDGMVVVGADASDSPTTSQSGSAYVFTDEDGDGSWDESRLTASDAASRDFFGRSVSVDAGTVVVGADMAETGQDSSGAAYVFTRSTSAGPWEETKLSPADPGDTASFGIDVAIAAGRIVVGAYLDDRPVLDGGSAYVFTQVDDTWEQTKLIPDGGVGGELFGLSVATMPGTVIVGAPGNRRGGIGAGAAYAFTSPIVVVEAQALDRDEDGIIDEDDNCPDVANLAQMDLDVDGLGDLCDLDRDGDSRPDIDDAFPADPDEVDDTDGDGTGNNADPDDDGDGQSDTAEAECGSDPLDSASVSPDYDLDDLLDCIDPSPATRIDLLRQHVLDLIADASPGDDSRLATAAEDLAVAAEGARSLLAGDATGGKDTFKALQRAAKELSKVDSVGVDGLLADLIDIARELAAMALMHAEESRLSADCAVVDCDKADREIERAHDDMRDIDGAREADKAIQAARKAWDRANKAMRYL